MSNHASNVDPQRSEVASGDAGGSQPLAAATIESAVKAAHPLIDKVAASAHQAVDRAAGAATQTADALDAKTVQLQDVQARLIETAGQYMRERPLVTIGIAVASGYLLSSLLRRR